MNRLKAKITFYTTQGESYVVNETITIDEAIALLNYDDIDIVEVLSDRSEQIRSVLRIGMIERYDVHYSR